jgi:hypothetical protein
MIGESSFADLTSTFFSAAMNAPFGHLLCGFYKLSIQQTDNQKKPSD